MRNPVPLSGTRESTVRVSVMNLPPIATQLVGSWCKPTWLCDHDRVYGDEGTWWKLTGTDLLSAQDDAVRLALADQERAGLSVVTDGEQRRQTFSGHFYRIKGIDSHDKGAVTNFANDVGDYLTMKKRPTTDSDGPPAFLQPRVTGPLTWTAPILAGDVDFLRARTDRLTKVTLIGPTTLALRLVDEYYGSLEAVAFALADVLGAEAVALAHAGVDIVQFDEPEVHFRYSQVADFATEALDRAVDALRDTDVRTMVHVCYGYSKNIAEKRSTPVYAQALDVLSASRVDDISLEFEQPAHDPDLLHHTGTKGVALGVLNLDTEAPVETVDHIVERSRAAVEVIGPHRLRLAPDCGMWFLPRDHATAKITSMERAAEVLRDQYY